LNKLEQRDFFQYRSYIIHEKQQYENKNNTNLTTRMTTLVIDWDEAMQQCGDDEEFLRELLGDLRTETDTQMSQMEIIIQVRYIIRTTIIIVAYLK
jgi:hypothetical protein